MNNIKYAISVVAFCGAGALAQTTINFDGTGAPSTFGATVPLTELYAPLGVHFAGPQPGEGGAILDQRGSFGVNAHSGEAFLAFNRNVLYAQDPETIRFDTVQTYVEIFAAGGSSLTTFVMAGYNGGNLLDSDFIVVPRGSWGMMSISAARGFDTVVLREDGGIFSFVYDDLTFVPGPTTLSLLLLGAVATARRRS